MFNKLYDKSKSLIKENYKFIIGGLIGVFLVFFELPYVVYTPGGIVPLNDRIEVEEGYNSTGSFNMSYVSMRKGNIINILLSFAIPNWDLKDKSDVTISDESVDDLLKIEKVYMTSSINNATILAFKKAGKELEITGKINNVIGIEKYADTNILLQDEIISVEDKRVSAVEELREIVATHEVGDKIDILVKRNGKEKNCYAIVKEDDGNKRIGIAFLTTYEFKTNQEVKVKTKSSESGSSGGLMLSLAIYNNLVEEDITKGKKVVGTGTINIDGEVGEIDGVKYKILGASKKKADIFICPEENYEEAIEVKKEFKLDIRIEKVKTFDEALEVLKTL